MADGTVAGDKKVTFGDSPREIEDNGEESEYAESSGEQSRFHPQMKTMLRSSKWFSTWYILLRHRSFEATQ